MSDAASDPVTLENSMLGLSLLEGMLDPEHEEAYQMLVDQGPDELTDLLIQFTLQWLAYESRVHEMPMADYLRKLRVQFVSEASTRDSEANSTSDE